ncbi:DUF167 domain-containing protein [Mycoplana rhizolycopersici]|uniref:UPF0235 protein HV823_00965 n=1 Tax=Mycoplana rhizolycopersici TaxID=2746702 RepID=A0ABX2Q7Y8_9HYPH|nr:DUF167 domain-containing protein [Rhizobium rhizolycopersici]NVP53813.1 DUF167 domain-containing protein [Rhizobium rhizolycopersici]
MPYRRHEHHISLTVRLTPNGSRDAIDGVETDAAGERHLKARVRAAPEKGLANKALIALVAKSAGVAKSNVSILSGDTQRKKILRIEGDPEDIVQRLGL